MQTQFSTSALLSAYAWLDYTLLQKGQAYTNVTTPFYYQPDPVLGPNYVCYQAPFKSFVWDSGVSGAYIMQGVSGSMGYLTRASGVQVDFVNGRVVLPASYGANLVLTGTYAFKDFNVYFANQSQERTLFTNKYYLNSRFALTGRPPARDNVTPCIFVSNGNQINNNWAIGGLYNTSMVLSLNILAENQNQLQGAMSILVDQKEGYMPRLGPSGYWPLNGVFNDYKPSGWNYVGNVLNNPTYSTPSNLFFIKAIKATSVSDFAKLDENIFMGIVDMTIEYVRNIH